MMADKEKLVLVQYKISDLIPADYNPRQLTEKQFKDLKASIEKFGQMEPAIVNTHKDRKNIIVSGHQRLRVATALNMTEWPCIEVNLTLKKEKELNIRMNKNTGEWDMDSLANNFDVPDLIDWGFDDLSWVTDTDEALTDEDSVPEPPVEPISKLGDLYQLGEHRLLCGDSTNIQHVEQLMDGEKADMVFTDPPYNIDYGNIKHPKSKQRSIENDNMTRDEFKDFCVAFVSCIKLSCNGCVYVFGPPGPDGRVMFTALDDALHCSTTIVWNKDRFTLGRGKYQNKYEPCWFGWNESGAAFIDDRKLTNVWDFQRPHSSKLHPTMKPVELVENALAHASNNGGKILDLFGGSGSTLIACEKTNRKCRMMELDPKYCDVIIKRWEEYTGKKAERLELVDG